MLWGHTDFVVSPNDFLPKVIEEKIKLVIDQRCFIRETLKHGLQENKALALNAGLRLKKILHPE